MAKIEFQKRTPESESAWHRASLQWEREGQSVGQFTAHQKGYEQGREAGCAQGTLDGYDAGYLAGYQAAMEAAIKRVQTFVQSPTPLARAERIAAPPMSIIERYEAIDQSERQRMENCFFKVGGEGNKPCRVVRRCEDCREHYS